MLELWLVHLDNFDEEWSNFKVNWDSLCFDGEKSDVLSGTSKVPGVEWQVCHLWLKISDWSELSCWELKFSLNSIELKAFNIVNRPAVLDFIPNSDLWLIVLCGEHIWWKLEDDTDWLDLDSRCRIWILDALKRVFNRKNISNDPISSWFWWLWVLIHLAKNDTSSYNVRRTFVNFMSRNIVKTSPHASHN